MKRKTLTFIAIIAITIFLWGASYYIAHKGVGLDPMIEQFLKEEYKVNDVSAGLVQSIEKLDLSNKNLTSIEGLEAFVNLKELNLSGNLITDASPLTELTELVKLDLSFNQLTNLSLKSEQLEELDVEGNRLISIEFVQQLPKLQGLNLRANKVVDLTPLQSLTLLEKLNLRGNQVKSLAPLENIRTLQDLNVRNNQIQTIEPIAQLPLNKRIYLSGNDIVDLHLLKDRLHHFDDYDFEIPIPRPTFRRPSGVYTEPFALELRTEKSHRIYYTLDGSHPTVNSHVYREPIEITKELMMEQEMLANIRTSSQFEPLSLEKEQVKKAITVTAVSYILGEYSEPVSHTYILEDDVFESNLPVISLVVQPKDFFDDDGGIYVPGNTYEEGYMRTGNYHLRGRAHEKLGTFEYFNENGELSFRQNVGLRINGSYTRVLPQKSLRIYPRSDYGQSRIYAKLFEDLPYHEFNRLVLRSSGNDNNSTMLRDGLMHELIKDRGIDVQAYKPVIVLLNGEYWGIHNIREKFTSDYIDIKYNVKESDLTMMTVGKKEDKFFFEMEAGLPKEQQHYFDMMDYIRSNDLTEEEHIEYVNRQMDIENFLEYVAYQVYYANTDSFRNNMMLWRKKTDFVANAPIGHDGRWRWMLYDLDFGMGYDLLGVEGDPLTFNMLEFISQDRPEFELFNALMENDSVKAQFTKLLLSLLEENFKPENVHQKIDELANVIRPEIGKTIERWENIESVEVWEENIDLLHRFADERPKAIIAHLKESFHYTDEQLEQMKKEVRSEK